MDRFIQTLRCDEVVLAVEIDRRSGKVSTLDAAFVKRLWLTFQIAAATRKHVVIYDLAKGELSLRVHCIWISLPNTTIVGQVSYSFHQRTHSQSLLGLRFRAPKREYKTRLIQHVFFLIRAIMDCKVNLLS